MHSLLIVDVEEGMGIQNKLHHLHKHGMYLCVVENVEIDLNFQMTNISLTDNISDI